MFHDLIKSSETREDPRYPFHWPVAIVFDSTDKQETYHGRTHEVSISGCSLLTEHNVFTEHQVTLLLSLPTEHPGGQRRLIEIKAQMVYTVLSSGHKKFRCGIKFQKFKDGGHAKLADIIYQRPLRVSVAD